MPRSADALKRRAEKRNITEKEMRKIDSAQQPAAKKMKSEGGVKGARNLNLKKWTCKVCTNKNLAHMCPKKCNNCQRPRVEVDEEYEYGSSRSSSSGGGGGDIIPKMLVDKKPDVSSLWKCMKCNNKNMTKFFPTTCNRCQRARSTEPEEQEAKITTKEESSDHKKKVHQLVTNSSSNININSSSDPDINPPVKESKSKENGITVDKVSGRKRDRSVDTDTDIGVDTTRTHNHADKQKHPVSMSGSVSLSATPSSSSSSSSSEFWTCVVCNNRNICAVHKLTCNRCQRHRATVEAKSTATTTAVAAVSSSSAAEGPSNTHWSCLVCKNRNICAVHKLTCNRCQRHRAEVEDKKSCSEPAAVVVSNATSTPNKPSSSSSSHSLSSKLKLKQKLKQPGEMWTCVKCKNQNLVSLSLSSCNLCQRPRIDVDASASAEKVEKKDHSSVEEKKLNSWDTAVADKDLIAKNMQLREDYLNPETCKSLSEEEKKRAEVLIERSKRKLEKKEKRQAWKKKIKKR